MSKRVKFSRTPFLQNDVRTESIILIEPSRKVNNLSKVPWHKKLKAEFIWPISSARIDLTSPYNLNPSRPGLEGREKIIVIIILKLLKALKASIKPFEAPQKRKWKLNLFSILIQLSKIHGAGRVEVCINKYNNSGYNREKLVYVR